MEAVIFIGIQGAGKSTFYRERFFHTHVRINLDMLKTRHREKLLLEACLAAKQSLVIDNTNPSAQDRRHYIEAAKAAGFTVVGYYIQSKIEDCKVRNENRPPHQVVPFHGLLGTAGRLQLPCLKEGFDKLYYVQINSDGGFIVEDWQDG